LTEEAGTASYPTVSEQGLVAYVLARDGESSIRVLKLDGAVEVVHTTMNRLSPPSWRPGGGVLIFGEQDSPETSRLQLLLLGEPRVLKPLSDSEDLFAARAAWRSGAEFLYTADGQLWRRGIATPTREPVHLNAAAVVEVAAPPAAVASLDDAAARPAFAINGLVRSADGRRSAFTALGDVWLTDRGEPRRLTDDPFVDLDPAFWPDGDSLVFASERTGQFELWRLELRESRSTQLTFGALRPRRPAVRPDGNAVAYLESASLEPATAAVVKVLELRRREESTVATKVVGATALGWADDGRTLIVRARSAEPVAGRDIRVDLGTGAPPAAGANAEARPSVDWRIPAPPPDYVVEVGRLFDGVRGAYRRHVDVHVRGGRIAAIVGRGVLPPGGPVIDAREATVIPGLIDLHAHQSARRRAPRPRVASLRHHGGARARDGNRRGRRALRGVGERPLAGAALAGIAGWRGGTELEPGRPRRGRNRAWLGAQPPSAGARDWRAAVGARGASGTSSRRRRHAGLRARVVPRIHGLPRQLEQAHRFRHDPRDGPCGAVRTDRLARAAPATRRRLRAIHACRASRVGTARCAGLGGSVPRTNDCASRPRRRPRRRRLGRAGRAVRSRRTSS
jgi:hypothetical protein